jgi:hypothetical protein
VEGTAPVCLHDVCRENTFLFIECMWRFLLISERLAIIFLYSLYLIITEAKCVYCAVRAASFIIIQVSVNLLKC